MVKKQWLLNRTLILKLYYFVGDTGYERDEGYGAVMQESTIDLVFEAVKWHKRLHDTEPKRVYLGWKRYEEAGQRGMVETVEVSESIRVRYFMGMILRMLDDEGYGVEVR